MSKNEENTPNSISEASPDQALFTPTPIEEFDFPVNAAFVNLSKMYMRQVHWAWHDDVELFVVNNGQVVVKFSDQQVILSPGEGMFINQTQLHSVHAMGEGECSVYSLKFHPAFLFGYGQTQLSTKYLDPVLAAPSLKYLVLKEEDEETSEILNLLNNVMAVCLTKRFGYELKVKSDLCSLWYCLLSFCDVKATEEQPPAPPQFGSDEVRIKQAITFIEEKYMLPLSLDEIADYIHVSKSECCRCFQRTIGLSPFEYLIKFRIFESTRKMAQGDEDAESISTLAASVGFNSTSYYNKLFKKYLNCTPTEYKRALQTKMRKNPGKIF